MIRAALVLSPTAIGNAVHPSLPDIPTSTLLPSSIVLSTETNPLSTKYPYSIGSPDSCRRSCFLSCTKVSWEKIEADSSGGRLKRSSFLTGFPSTWGTGFPIVLVQRDLSAVTAPYAEKRCDVCAANRPRWTEQVQSTTQNAICETLGLKVIQFPSVV